MNWNTNAGSASQLYLLVNPPVFAWTNLTWILAATGTNTVLQFGAENIPSFFGLDDISVIPVSPPVFQAVSDAGGFVQLGWSTTAGSWVRSTSRPTCRRAYYPTSCCRSWDGTRRHRVI